MTEAAAGGPGRNGRGPESLEPAYRRSLGDRRFIAVSNREPYEHYWDDAAETVSVRRPAGGLVAALDPLMQAVRGTWVAWGSGDRDRASVDSADHVEVPPEDPAYTLRRVWLDQHDVRQYYEGYSNQFLWPLCHLRPALTRTRLRFWDRYQAVNRRFAQAALEEAGDGDAAIWIQDYHLATAPHFVREARPDVTTSHFWHIPFPPLEIFRVATQAPELLRGLLANDLVGFHIPLFGENFLRVTEAMLPHAEVDWATRSVRLGDHACHVRSFPISIDVETYRGAASSAAATSRVARIREQYAPGDSLLGVGVDRIDYSKGLEEKVRMLELLFEHHPEYRGRFTYVQVAAPSRTGIAAYDRLGSTLERAVYALNERFGTDAWTPVHLLKQNIGFERLAALYRAADVCIVSSLQDGMNLVAKEFVACQTDSRGGVLMLSQFAGAAQELDGSCHFNPYDVEAAAVALRDCLEMPVAARRERMARLQGSLRTIHDWMVELFEVWGAAAKGEPVPLTPADGWSMSS